MGSGRIYGSVTSNSNKFNYFLDWTSEINIEGNYSTVSVKTYWSPKSGYEYWDFDTTGARNASITINGSTYSVYERFSTGNDWSNGNPYFIMSHAVKVYHDADGTKSITISARANGRAADDTTSYGPSSSASSSGDCVIPETKITLDTIPRTSAVYAFRANIGGIADISIVKAASNFTHTLRYEYGSFSDTIVENLEGNKYYWIVPTSFYNETPNSFGIATIYCDTYNGSQLIGTTNTELRVEVANSAPILAPSATDSNSKTVALTGDNNKFIKYYSGVSAAVNATAQNGATITKQTITINGKTHESSIQGITTGVESGTFTFSATDSRGFTTTQTLNKTLIEYIKLTCDVRLISASADGIARIGISGNYFNQNFGAADNTLTLSYKMKEEGGNYPLRGTAISNKTISGNTYETVLEVSGLDYKKKYTFQITAVDKLATVYSTQLAVTCEPVFDWGRDDFNVNGTVSMNGHNVLRHNSTANNIVLSASGGAIYLRPQGTNETTGEIRISSLGNIEITGDIIINGQSVKSLLGIQ